MSKVLLRNAAFTLVELLVVISIISMLMSILMPALQNARQSAERIVCMSNLKQQSMGWHFFAGDHDGQLVRSHSEWNEWNRFPDDCHWVCDGPTSADPLNNTEAAMKAGGLWPYLQTVKLYQCPVQPKEFPRSFEISPAMGNDDWFVGTHWFRNYAQITSPSERLLFICNIHMFRVGEYRHTQFWPLGDINPVIWADVPAPGISEMRQSHPGGTNISYADMHIGKWKWEDPRTLQWINWEISSEKASPDNADLKDLAYMLNIEWKQ